MFKKLGTIVKFFTAKVGSISEPTLAQLARELTELQKEYSEKATKFNLLWEANQADVSDTTKHLHSLAPPPAP